MSQFHEQTPARPSKIVRPEDADARLAEMGLSVAKIRNSVTTGDDARSRVSLRYYPRNFPGVTMWAETLAALRRELLKVRQGWRIGQTGNYETVYSAERRLAFAVVAGDRFTGLDGARPPRLTRKRGPKTKERVDRNAEYQQLAFEIDLPVLANELPPDEACSTWFLVVYADDDHIRMEVSLPVDVKDGFVGEWVERILIDPIPTSGAVAPIEPGEDDDDDGEPMVTRTA
ncbi:hypothetical protein [Streptomyces sp. 1-11]|uniref:hypothetical protein n=1 Tax=unclassified Streptomyces TaxID=2593676 RepID=UPI00116BC0BE|nr:hypothetical protein [Streptomyces sp. 1-11]GEJ99332.1 hypothetical protein TNCT1_16090 [Streptomyces sp. 1-11]